MAIAGWRRRFGSVAFAAGFALFGLGSLACSSTSNQPAPVDGSSAVDRPVPRDSSPRLDVAPDAAGFQCGFPTQLKDSIAGTCVPARAFVTCTVNGNSASYQASDPMGCLSCAGTCEDSCKLSELALSCGVPRSDAGATPSDPTFGCRVGFVAGNGSVTYCCPCR